MDHTLAVIIFGARLYPFPSKYNILPSANWLQCHLPGREWWGGIFTLPSRVIPVKKACDSSCRMTQALMVFLESSHNQFNVSDPKTNVSFCLQHHQQFSKLWLLFHMPCKRFRELSTGWKQRAPDILVYFHSLDGYNSEHSLFLSISISKKGRLKN